MSWFSSQFNRWSEAAREGAASMFGPDGNNTGNSAGSSSAAEIRRVEIIWGKQHLQIVLPKAVQPPTLRNLKDELVTFTAVPLQQQKLIFQGLRLKDDRAPLSAYGIREGSKLTLIGTAGGVPEEQAAPVIPPGRLAAEEAERARRVRDADDSEEGLLRRIEQTLKGVEEDLKPEVEQLEREITTSRNPTPSATTEGPRPGATSTAASAPSAQPTSTAAASQTPPPSSSPLDAKQISALHRKLSELLLRALLALDTIPVNSDTQRVARKSAVRTVQSYLDRVDQAWESYKTQTAAASAAQL
ncbi:hypothetical protein OC842_006848 [Tilletia horrida]|uniref:Ubiquitin-like domain-containing protein n=1 Tax=Tilletia horrida TaxID=155126 RepID=A0AAN6G5E5_9BASI|nr:hypothetical protein OC842_006848 [Tilletia horrida]